MSKTTLNEGVSFTEAIGKTIRREIMRIIEEEAALAADRVQKRVAEKADAIALKLLSNYDVQRGMNQIVISVRKAAEGITL